MLPIGRLNCLLFVGLITASSLLGQEAALFSDVTDRVGLDFEHHSGARGELLFPEILGAGAALFDYDQDGDLDLYLVESSVEDPSEPLLGGQDRLYRNDQGTRRNSSDAAFTFVEVTQGALLRSLAYGIGVAIGDVDRDGFEDIYVTNYGPNQLWHNRGDGTFEDWTARSGLELARDGRQKKEWSSSAAFFDYDGDGWLDLFVANYVDSDVDPAPNCFTATSERDYCGPAAFEPTGDRLFRNLGQGNFEERTVESGIGAASAAGLGVLELDVNQDGHVDILVANDQVENHLWLNRGDGTFSEEGLWWGFAVDVEGKQQASMGIAAADWDHDGDEDVMLTHLLGESNTLYSAGASGFDDTSRRVGMRRGSFSSTGFGVAWLDVDQDGWLDLFVVNGEVKRIEALARIGESRPFQQPDQLFLNRKGEHLELVPSERLPRADAPQTGRGLAVGDLDLDGLVDLVITNNHGPAWVWLGASQSGSRPLVVDVGSSTPVRLESSRGSRLRRNRRNGSFASSSQASARFFTLIAEDARVVIERPVTTRILEPPAGKTLVVRRRR